MEIYNYANASIYGEIYWNIFRTFVIMGSSLNDLKFINKHN